MPKKLLKFPKTFTKRKPAALQSQSRPPARHWQPQTSRRHDGRQSVGSECKQRGCSMVCNAIKSLSLSSPPRLCARRNWISRARSRLSRGPWAFIRARALYFFALLPSTFSPSGPSSSPLSLSSSLFFWSFTFILFRERERGFFTFPWVFRITWWGGGSAGGKVTSRGSESFVCFKSRGRRAFRRLKSGNSVWIRSCLLVCCSCWLYRWVVKFDTQCLI